MPFRVDISSYDYYFWSDTFSILVEQPVQISRNNQTIPREFRLYQNYPNPFNPNTAIEFELPYSVFVTLKIYTILGEEVATLVSDRLSAGYYKYNWDFSDLASGVYLCRFETENFIKTRKLILQR
jgi:hypothetical protein